MSAIFVPLPHVKPKASPSGAREGRGEGATRKPDTPWLTCVVPVGLACLVLAACGTSPGASTAVRDAASFGIPARAGVAGESGQAIPAWETFVLDPAIRELVRAALTDNRDLRVSLLAVERSQAQLRASQANRWPQLGVGGTAQRAPNTQGNQVNTFTAGVQMPAWEIDFFGRLAALDDAARAQLLSSQAGQRAAELALVAAVANTVLALRTDAQLLAISRRTLDTREESLRLVTLRERQGAASMVDVDSQAVLAAQAKAAVAQFERQVAQDTSALQLLVGRELQAAEVDAARAAGPDASSASNASNASNVANVASGPLMDVPAGIASTALLDRPDVIAAERQLDAAQANVSAARKALLPAVTLTAQAGQASTSLRDMFDRGSFAYTVAANLFFAIFDGGRRQAGIDIAESTQRAALAQYEKAVQSAFRETADALFGVDTWRRQRAALDEQLRAAQDLSRLVDLKAQRGAASLLEQLEAQRNLFAAEQAAVQARQAEQASRVAVWKALGH
jgi:multidrug efflux system outer membrane protein